MKRLIKIFLVLLSSVLLLTVGIIGANGCMFTDDSTSVKSYAVGKTVTYAKAKYIVTATRTTTLNDIAAPVDYEYLIITVKIENTVSNRMTFDQLCWRYADPNHIEKPCLSESKYQTESSLGSGAIMGKNTIPLEGTISFLIKSNEKGTINFYYSLESLSPGFAIDLSKS